MTNGPAWRRDKKAESDFSMTERRSYQPYEAYAAIYERIDQGAFGRELATRTLRWVTTGERKPLHVLDLACGTGAASLVFAAAGHEVVAVDRSPSMLDLARARAERTGRTITFLNQDIRDLDLATIPRSFDLATCFFDSLNYLTGDNDFHEVCTRVGSCLLPDGLFIFDLHTPHELASWDERDEIVHDGADLLVYNRLSYDAERERAIGRVVWFERRNGHWWRGEETHVERPWSEAAVHDALAAGGMKLMAALTPDGAPADEQTPRVVYYARKASESQ